MQTWASYVCFFKRWCHRWCCYLNCILGKHYCFCMLVVYQTLCWMPYKCYSIIPTTVSLKWRTSERLSDSAKVTQMAGGRSRMVRWACWCCYLSLLCHLPSAAGTQHGLSHIGVLLSRHQVTSVWKQDVVNWGPEVSLPLLALTLLLPHLFCSAKTGILRGVSYSKYFPCEKSGSLTCNDLWCWWNYLGRT